MLAFGCALFVVVGLPGGAQACGCGALVSPQDAARVFGEHSMVWWDGKHETIEMRMLLAGSVEEAAWIMPVPKGATVSLGEKGVFDDLDDITWPRHRSQDTWWPPSFDWFDGSGDESLGAAPSGVRVRGHSDIGPFRVTTLAGHDPDAVNRWLDKRGYPAQPGLPDALQPYLRQGWDLLAVKLRPAKTQEDLSGSLAPLRLTFDADHPIYPIRLSRAADDDQSLRLYVVAPHRMEVADQAAPRDPAEVEYAGWVRGSRLGHDGAGRMFLTRYDAELDPEAIEADYTFKRAATDETYRKTVYVVDDHTGLTGALIVLAVLVFAVGGVIVYAVVGRRRRRCSA